FRRFTKSLAVFADECLSIHIFFSISSFVGKYSEKFDSSSIYLQISLLPLLPCLFIKRWKSLVNNLMVNAVRYNRPGGEIYTVGF
ncbi:MAG: hypothetical protein H9791_09000, partial [Candidatus Bacteroides intestinipullorum]|nr:hypothetical protein [Candidatus Bacteroides intestinipullorum]